MKPLIDASNFYVNRNEIYKPYLAANIDHADNVLKNWYGQIRKFGGRGGVAFGLETVGEMLIDPEIAQGLGRDGFIDQSKKLFTEFGKTYWENKDSCFHAVKILNDDVTYDVIGSSGVAELTKFVVDQVVTQTDLKSVQHAWHYLSDFCKDVYTSPQWNDEDSQTVNSNIWRVKDRADKIQHLNQRKAKRDAERKARQKPSIYNLMDDLLTTPAERKIFYQEQIERSLKHTLNTDERRKKLDIMGQHLAQPDTLDSLKNSGSTENQFNNNAADMIQTHFNATYWDRDPAIHTNSVDYTLNTFLRKKHVRTEIGAQNTADLLGVMADTIADERVSRPSADRIADIDKLTAYIGQSSIITFLSDAQQAACQTAFATAKENIRTYKPAF